MYGMRTGIDGLSLHVQQALGRPPCDGTAYVFANRRRTRLKLVCWDGTGVWMWNRDGELAIYSVYYAADGTVNGYSAKPTTLIAETHDELRDECRRYLAALDEPVLIYEND